MNKQLAYQIQQDIQCISLQQMQASTVFLQPFSSAYSPVPFSENNFIMLTPKQVDKTFLFIDGGCAEILKTPDYSLQFMRFGCVGFIGAKRFFSKKKEGYVLVTSQSKEGKVFFTTITYGDISAAPSSAQSSAQSSASSSASFSMPFSIPHDSHLLASSSQRTKVEVVAELFRKVYEISFAEEIIQNNIQNNIQKNAVLILDRPLLPENSFEENAFASLYAAAEMKNTIVCGIAKTTALLCNTGESVIQHLQNYKQKAPWLYTPVFSSYDLKHNTALSFVKLHSLSRHIFRFEIYARQKDNLIDVASWLAWLSNDAVFLGYPYGLIVADQLARVSNREKEYLQTLFFSHIGNGNIGKNDFATTALDAHEILDGK